MRVYRVRLMQEWSPGRVQETILDVTADSAADAKVAAAAESKRRWPMYAVRGARARRMAPANQKRARERDAGHASEEKTWRRN